MHRADIKALVEKRGYTLRALDVKFGFPLGTIADTFRYSRPTAEIALANFLDIPPQKLFPNRYTKDGQKLRHPLPVKSDKTECNTKRRLRKSTDIRGER